MEYRILGPLEIVGDDGQPIEVTAPKQRALLISLLLRANEAVATDRLVDALWGGTPPASATKLVQVYVSQLRLALGDRALETRSPGYVLTVEPEDFDAARFERLLADGREALAEGNPQLAASLFRRGLALWRGPALADAAYAHYATTEATRLEEVRLIALEERIGADLEAGRHQEVLAELTALVAEHPLRERLRAHLMLALYRSGRQADALSAYRDARRTLDDRLGIEPGEELRALEREILRQDPKLAAPGRTEKSASPLPAPLTPLVGRARELDQLRRLLSRDEARLVVLTGAGGSGKTRLALEAARTVEPTFANGTAFVELAPVRDGGLVVSTIARALDVQEVPGAEPLETLVDAVRARELLLVVDNAEHLREDAPVYVQLLSRCPRLTILVTSRGVLHLSGEHVFPVLPLPEEDAVELFRQRSRAVDPAFELTDDNEPAVREVCRRVDCLPLALELAAGCIRTMTPQALLERLVSRLTVLTGGPRDLPARQQTLRETLDWSTNLLDEGTYQALVRLAVFPGGATPEAAKAVCGADRATLETLVDHNLARYADERFGLLETIREYGLELLGDERPRIEQAHAAFFLRLVESFPLRGPAAAENMRTLDREVDNIRAAVDVAVSSADTETELRLVGVLWRYWWVRGYLQEGRARAEGALARSTDAQSGARLRALYGAAGLAWAAGDYAAATRFGEELLASARVARSDADELAAHNVLGTIALNEHDFASAEQHFTKAIALSEKLDSDWDLVTAKLNLGVTMLDSGRPQAAVPVLEDVLAYHSQHDIGEGVGFARLNLAHAAYLLDDLHAAREHFEEARSAFAAVGFRAHVGHALQGLAAVEARSGSFEKAACLLGRAETVLADVGASQDGFAPALPAEAEASARAELGDAAFIAAYEGGRRAASDAS